ncbi:MAG: pyruvate, phosphate dikinase [Nitrospirae bacterium]|nr:pyruvate, phosphate dikinase [Nitrospirota bacterium]
MFKFLDMLRKTKPFQRDEAGKTTFQNKYLHFRNLLAGNNHALEIMTDLEQVCYGAKPFSLGSIYDQVEGLLSQARNIAGELNALSGGKYGDLFDSVEKIGAEILQELAKKRTVEKTGLTIPLQYLSLEQVSEVGGKAANLGEIANRVHLPVPPGFAITAYACHYFMNSNNLYSESEKILKDLDVEDTGRLLECSREVQECIMRAPLPADLEASILAEVDVLINKFGPGIRLAVRSSATSEDSEASFAGQHSSVLGATRENVIQAYKEVVASTFNPRAVYYRRGKGYPDENVVMSVLCVGMVRAKSSGVMYTMDPNDHRRNVLLVNAVWGLAGAVDGSAATDFYEVEKVGRRILTARTAEKATMITLEDSGGIKVVPVEQELRTQQCLDSEQLMSLVEYGLTLEEHYGVPLDIEWAVRRRDNKLLLLQARPLNLNLMQGQAEDAKRDRKVEALREKFPGNPVLLQGGITASRGKACGLSYILTSNHNLLNIPEGVILIAPETSPRYVSILGRVQAIVTDVGSVTGHMASVAREFSVPTLVGTGNATKNIPPGEEITVDATNCLIFKGRVESILERKKPANPMKGSPIYKAAHSALKKIAVLNLLDPKDQNFSPQGCRTLHDIIRFAHEKAMREMFRISDVLEVDQGFAVQIKVPLPMQMLAVDLGGGLNIGERQTVAGIKDVTSTPFLGLLRGMTHPGVQWAGPVGINMGGLISVIASSMLYSPDPAVDSSFGGPSYVVISGEYLNFNSRLGYHFAVVDAYCGPQVNDNYITFSFKGGAADIGRRSRRALLISRILKRLGLNTEIRGDMVRGEIKKYECSLLQEKLDMIGRLLGAVRLLDMVLSDEGDINWYEDEFFKENYTFQRRDPKSDPVLS